MARSIGAVVAGYLVMVVVVFVSFTVAYLILGADGSFKPGSFDVSNLWVAISFIVGLGAAIVGGLVCAAISTSARVHRFLACFVFALGLLFALPVLIAGTPTPKQRTADVGNMEAMQTAVTPAWVALLNPVVGAVGVMIGAGLRGGRKSATGPT